MNAVRVLVIEDDEGIRSVVQRGLSAEGFEVDVADDGTTGLEMALAGGYAAIVLDLLLPGLNGYRVCAHLRGEGSSVPILVLTAKAGEFDQIDLLDAGADDFLTKPVGIGVIAARLRALIRPIPWAMWRWWSKPACRARSATASCARGCRSSTTWNTTAATC